MNKQSNFTQECIRKFISKDIPNKFIYNNNYVAVKCNKGEGSMLKDVIVWDIQILQEKLLLVCPACTEESQLLHSVRCKDGNKDHKEPHSVYGTQNDALLISRVYMCPRKHQIIAHGQN